MNTHPATPKIGDPADTITDAKADGEFAGARPGTFEGALDRLRRGFAPSRKEGEILLDHIATLTADRDALARCVGHLCDEWHFSGHVDGGDLQEWLAESGVLREETMQAPCGETCTCAEVMGPNEFPLKCFRYTELGKFCQSLHHSAALPSADGGNG
jgi:hypothetical protein